jgi:DNA-binding CsgD family transcriptional regulator/tetratricopeptide (TPR) repeat protein
MDAPLVPQREPDPPVGRTREIEYLTGVLDAVERGERRACIFLGVPGAGKTMLLRYARRLCQSQRFETIFVRAATMGMPPLFPIGEIVERLVEIYSRLETDTPDFILRMTEALSGGQRRISYRIAVPQIVEATEQVAKVSPLAILFDDYHWAPGEGTSLLLAALRVVEAPVLFLATARIDSTALTEQISLAEPTGDLWFDHFHLDLLDYNSIRLLTQNELGPHVLKSIPDFVFMQSQGNPLYAAELLRDWRSNEVIVNVGGYWGFTTAADPPIPRSLHEVLSRRLTDLDSQSLKLARGLALLGREASFRELTSIGPQDNEETVSLLRRLIRAGVVREEGTPPRYQLSHPLYAPTLLARMGGTEQAILHERLFRGLSEAGATKRSSELAHHAYRSLNRPAELSILIRQAAEEADRVGGYEESARWYERLADTQHGDSHSYVEALERQAVSLSNFAPGEAVLIFSKALEYAHEGEESAHLLLGRAKASRHLGHFDDALVDLHRALASANSTDQAAIRFLIASILGIQGHIVKAERALEELARESLPPELRASVLGNLGTAAFTRGEVPRALNSFLDSFNASSGYSERMQAATNLVWCYMIVGQWSAARELLDSSIREADKRRDDWHLIGLLTDAARLNAWEARFPEAMESYVNARRLVPRLENPLWQIECLETFGIIQLESRKFHEAEKALAKAGTLIRDTVETRDPAFTLTHVAEAKYRIDDIGGARRSLEEARASLNGNPTWTVSIERIDALCALSEGKGEDALLRLKYADAQATELPFERGKVLESLGEALTTLRRRDEAIESFERSREVFDALGAKGRSAFTSDRIAQLTSSRPGRPRNRTLGDFTPRETDVLRLLVRGRRSSEIAQALFISKRTVDKHIERMLDRSNARTRTELVSLALRQNLLSDG